jgi:hypothetical protein
LPGDDESDASAEGAFTDTDGEAEAASPDAPPADAPVEDAASSTDASADAAAAEEKEADDILAEAVDPEAGKEKFLQE